MKVFRPSGDGVVGKQGVVYETHLVARASRPSGIAIGGFFHALRELNHVVPPALFRPEGPTLPLPVATATGRELEGFFLLLQAPGPRGPGSHYAAPSGLASRVNMRCIAAMEFLRILFQARRANASIY